MTADAAQPDAGNPSAFHRRILRWLKKPPAERNRQLMLRLETTPFRYGKAHMPDVFLAYQPDSYATFKQHPEFDALFERFLMHKKLNNAGDIARLWSFILNLKQLLAERIEGDFAELGVWRGNTAAVLAHVAALDSRQVFLFDTFEGFDRNDIKGIDAGREILFADTSIELVKQVIGEPSRVCSFAKGYFPDTVTQTHRSRQYAAVSLDCDLYEPMRAGLEFFYPLMPRGGLFLLHDYSSMHWAGAKQAIDEFCRESGEFVVLMPDKSGSAFLRKSR